MKAAAWVLCLLIVTIVWAQEPSSQDPQEAFPFVQVCDTQLGFGGYEATVARFEQAVRQINALRPAFVLICGDLVQNPDARSWKDFKRIKAGFTVPCHCAAGNHDVGKVPTKATLQTYRTEIGKDFYSFEHGGYTFLVANTQLWKTTVPEESARHEAWFRKALKEAAAKARPVIVVGHYPLFVSHPEEPENYSNLPRAKRKELLDLFAGHGVVAVLTGHTHAFMETRFRGMHMVSGETTSRNFDQRPAGFRLWQAGPDKTLKHEFVPLLSPDASEN